MGQLNQWVISEMGYPNPYSRAWMDFTKRNRITLEGEERILEDGTLYKMWNQPQDKRIHINIPTYEQVLRDVAPNLLPEPPPPWKLQDEKEMPPLPPPLPAGKDTMWDLAEYNDMKTDGEEGEQTTTKEIKKQGEDKTRQESETENEDEIKQDEMTDIWKT